MEYVFSRSHPYSIVLQFHGFNEGSKGILSLTLQHEMRQCKLGLTNNDWISICAQILGAVDYLHTNAEVLQPPPTLC